MMAQWVPPLGGGGQILQNAAAVVTLMSVLQRGNAMCDDESESTPFLRLKKAFLPNLGANPGNQVPLIFRMENPSSVRAFFGS